MKKVPIEIDFKKKHIQKFYFTTEQERKINIKIKLA